MVRVSVILVFAALCLVATAKKPGGGGGNKPEKPEGGNGGNGGNKPEKPEKPEGGNGGNGGNKPEKPEGGNGGNKPDKPMSCDVATNWPCLMKGDICVEGTDGATCQEAETNMTMPCTGLTMPDVWSMIGCAG